MILFLPLFLFVQCIWTTVVTCIKVPLDALCTVSKSILKVGNNPKHVAFIMDGNRRYGRKHNFSSTTTAHSLGFDSLKRVSVGWVGWVY